MLLIARWSLLLAYCEDKGTRLGLLCFRVFLTCHKGAVRKSHLTLHFATPMQIAVVRSPDRANLPITLSITMVTLLMLLYRTPHLQMLQCEDGIWRFQGMKVKRIGCMWVSMQSHRKSLSLITSWETLVRSWIHCMIVLRQIVLTELPQLALIK